MFYKHFTVVINVFLLARFLNQIYITLFLHGDFVLQTSNLIFFVFFCFFWLLTSYPNWFDGHIYGDTKLLITNSNKSFDLQKLIFWYC